MTDAAAAIAPMVVYQRQVSGVEFAPDCADNTHRIMIASHALPIELRRAEEVKDVETPHRSWLLFIRHFARGSIAKSCGLDGCLLVQI